MKLNALEFLLMNNPVRAFSQEHYELKIMKSLATIGNIENALEIGCGNGNGTRLIRKHFSPKNIISIDLDERMINLAQKNNSDSSSRFIVMDASKLDFPDSHFDAVFDFGIIHHIPNWKDCILELHRVLKPGGKIILEELSIDTFSRGTGKIWRKLLRHPYECMFSTEDFMEFLGKTGFDIKNFRESNPLKLMKFFSLTAEKKS